MANNDAVRKQIHSIYDLISTSHHEAGHTIYGLLNFIKIESVYVYQNPKNKRIEGLTNYDSPDFSVVNDSNFFHNLLKAEISIKYAGLLAEKCHFKKISGSDKFPMFLRDGSSEDTLSAAALIKKYAIVAPGRKRYAFKKKLIKETSDLLQNNWDAISIVAHNLFQKKKLSYEDLKTILCKKTNNPKFWKDVFNKIDHIYENLETLDEHSLKIILSK